MIIGSLASKQKHANKLRNDNEYQLAEINDAGRHIFEEIIVEYCIEYHWGDK